MHPSSSHRHLICDAVLSWGCVSCQEGLSALELRPFFICVKACNLRHTLNCRAHLLHNTHSIKIIIKTATSLLQTKWHAFNRLKNTSDAINANAHSRKFKKSQAENFMYGIKTCTLFLLSFSFVWIFIYMPK